MLGWRRVQLPPALMPWAGPQEPQQGQRGSICSTSGRVSLYIKQKLWGKHKRRYASHSGSQLLIITEFIFAHYTNIIVLQRRNGPQNVKGCCRILWVSFQGRLGERHQTLTAAETF